LHNGPENPEHPAVKLPLRSESEKSEQSPRSQFKPQFKRLARTDLTTGSIDGSGTKDNPTISYLKGSGAPLGREPLRADQLQTARANLDLMGKELIENADVFLDDLPDGQKVRAAFIADHNAIYLRSNATAYELTHEALEAELCNKVGNEAYLQLSEYEREKYVYEKIINNADRFTSQEVEDARNYFSTIAEEQRIYVSILSALAHHDVNILPDDALSDEERLGVDLEAEKWMLDLLANTLVSDSKSRRPLSADELMIAQQKLAKNGAHLVTKADAIIEKFVKIGQLESNVLALHIPGLNLILLRENATAFELWHEVMHMKHDLALGGDISRRLPEWQREFSVYNAALKYSSLFMPEENARSSLYIKNFLDEAKESGLIQGYSLSALLLRKEPFQSLDQILIDSHTGSDQISGKIIDSKGI
jgi:hypothetical protein